MPTQHLSLNTHHSFTNFLQQKNIIPLTIKRHQREIDKYTTWLETHGKQDIQATQKDLLNYLQHIKEKRNLANATQNQLLQILKNYYAYLAQTQNIKNITQLIKIRGIKKVQLHQMLTNTDVELLCDAYYYHTQQYNPTNKEIRFYPNHQQVLLGYYITLTLLAQQALTINELLSLKKENFNLHKGTVTIPTHLKGNTRTLILEASQIGYIIAFYSTEPQGLLMLNKNHFEKLNLTLKTFLPTYKDFRQLRASKITQWIKAHGLRKAQVLAGHKNINSTEKYVANDITTLQNDMTNYHPLQ
jgi:site-specific recombinase XerD